MNIFHLNPSTKRFLEKRMLSKIVPLFLFLLFIVLLREILAGNKSGHPKVDQDFGFDDDLDLLDDNLVGPIPKFPTKVVLQGFQTAFAKSLISHLLTPGFEKTFSLFDVANREDRDQFFGKHFSDEQMLVLLDELSKCRFSKGAIELLTNRTRKVVLDTASLLLRKARGDKWTFAKKLKERCERSDMRIIDGSGVLAVVQNDQREMLNHTHHIFIMPNLRTQVAMMKEKLKRNEMNTATDYVCRTLADHVYTPINTSKTTFMLRVSDFMESKQKAFHVLRHSIWSEIGDDFYLDMKYHMALDRDSSHAKQVDVRSLSDPHSSCVPLTRIVKP